MPFRRLILVTFLACLFTCPVQSFADEDIEALVDLFTKSMPDRAAEWVCRPQRTFNCSIEGCKESDPSIVLVLNFSNKKYSRCDFKGCSDFLMEYTKSGVYTIIELTGRGTFMKASNDGSSFVDVASSGVGVIQNFGECSEEKL